jgi:hypothetical protein
MTAPSTPRLVAAREAAASGDLDRLRELLVERLELDAAPLETDEARRWLLLLVEQGAPDEDFGRLVARTTDREPLEELRRELAEPEPVADASPDPDDELDLGLRTDDRGRLPDATLDRFLRFFGGRRDLYARQWFDAARRRGGYHPVREPLRAEEARHHLEGKTTLGQYLLHADATVSFAVLDLDLSASALAELRATRGDDASPCDHGELRGFARRLVESARSLGIRLFPEDSGGRGMHLWVFFDTRRPARAARALLSQVLVAAGPQPADVSVELFPRQEQLGKRGLSSLVKLPLGIHRGTFRRCALLDDALRPIDDPTAALVRLVTTPDAVVDAVVGQRVVPLPLPPARPADDELVDEAPTEPLALPTANTPRSLAERLRAIPEGGEAEAACERVVAGCDAIAGLVSKAFERRSLAADEARAITYSLGLVRAPLARRVLVAAGASTRELDRVEGGLPSPIGCVRLRKVAGPCRGCPAPGIALPYPTPLLFAVGPVAPAPPIHKGFAPSLEQALAVPPPREVRARLDALEARIAKLEDGRAPPAPEEPDAPA